MAKDPKPTNVIQWENPGPEDIVWRYEHDDIRTISVLVVREHEVAVFYRDGQILDVIPPGKHTLTTGNIPVLTKVYSALLRYRESPFKAEIIFVSTKIFSGKWGLRTMIRIGPESRIQIPLMANGDYQFRVDDATLFLTQVAAGQRGFNTGAVTAFIRSFIIEQMMQQLSKQNYLDLYTNLEKASTSSKVFIGDYFTQRGMELLALKIADAQTDKENQDKVQRYEMVGGDGKFLEDRDAMVGVANGLGQSSGGGFGAGMMMMPQMMNQMMGQNQQNQTPKAVCPHCGVLNDYPYKFCKECGKPPVMQQQAAPAPAAGAAGGGKTFTRCPYCGEELNLPRPPKFCPYCSEQLQ